MNKFDLDAFTYDENPMHVERGKAIAEKIKQSLDIGRDWVIADFGCGTGLLGINFIEQVKCIDMIDTSENMLKFLSDKIQNQGFKDVYPVRMDILADRLPAEKYNLIVTLMAFHHIKSIPEALMKLAFMIKQGFYLAISDLDIEDGSYHPGEQPPHFGIDQVFLIKSALDAGFYLHHISVPYVVSKNNKNYPIFLHIYQKR
ncbi:class I SAM-dependent DNA methyltransferase [Calditerrivibrio sp.]|jgi:ubiquinone/menaquinone biosynthesis C-methylase UbiE|uniref:class I SAM-dependent DNA methyltransferase n=1 Tax=Calditerrivibrio sp. TaxID=2792612 RepID=UPI003D0F4021